MKEAKANEKRTGEIQVDEIPLYDAVVQRNYKDTVFRITESFQGFWPKIGRRRSQ